MSPTKVNDLLTQEIQAFFRRIDSNPDHPRVSTVLGRAMLFAENVAKQLHDENDRHDPRRSFWTCSSESCFSRREQLFKIYSDIIALRKIGPSDD
jgi:hypothetical protein